jgi:hypothetical protein
MNSIPQWIKELVERDHLVCSSCKRHFTIDDLMSTGIQLSSQKPHNETLVVGLFCKKCNELTIFEIKEMTLVDFSCMILEEEHSNTNSVEERMEDRKEVNREGLKEVQRQGSKYKRTGSRSKITLKEIQEASKILKSIKTHEEFLEMLGLTPDEIEKYKK